MVDSFNEIEVKTRDDSGGESPRSGVGIQILIDGTVYVEGDDYYLNIDTFFEALGQQASEIEFIGGCHYPPCCANGARTRFYPEAWVWNEGIGSLSPIRLRWSDVYEAVARIVKIIEEEHVWTANKEQLPFYRAQLTLLEKRVHSL